MRQLLLLGITVLSLSLGSPVATRANEIEKTVMTAQETLNDNFNSAITYTMYANEANVNIRKEPNTNSEILGQTLLNTSFDVVEDYNGWSMILTEDGVAYIKSEYLSDAPLTFTKEDLEILAHLIGGEAQYCDDNEQRYVASVVLNRVAHPEFPNTIKGVVFENGQYSCVTDGNYYRTPTKQNYKNACYILEHGSILPDSVIWQSGEKQGNKIYLKTKWHYYCN